MLRRSRVFTSEMPQLAEMRRFVRGCAEEAWPGDVPAAALDEIELALQEAATNVVRHAYGNEPGRPIQLDVIADEHHLEVTITHTGEDFDPEAVPPPSFDGSRTGGFGLHLIRTLMDEVCYLHGEPGCGVRMSKRRPAKGT
ncbi:MAG: ATP-binding protein [Gemmataceae bacterium]